MQVKLALRTPELPPKEPHRFIVGLASRILTFEVDGTTSARAATVVANLTERLAALEAAKQLEIIPAIIPIHVERAKIAVGANMRRCPAAAQTAPTDRAPSRDLVKAALRLLRTMTPQERQAAGLG